MLAQLEVSLTVPEPERPSLTLPAELERRAEAMVNGEQTWLVPPAMDAATVILLRPGKLGLEVLLQRRPQTMAFAGGMYVFPGGKVEKSDTIDAPWQGPSGYEPFQIPPQAQKTAHFRALTVAAARETWEEAGVPLITGPTYGQPDPGEPLLPWLLDRGGYVAGDCLRPWVHWVTPEVEERRFDVRFLVAAMPHATQAVDFGVETDDSVWVRPKDAANAAVAGQMPMLPPTLDALEQLADFQDVDSVLSDASGRFPRPYLPRPFRNAAGKVRWRIEDAYSGEVIEE